MSVADISYAAVMARSNEIMKAALGIDYDDFIDSPIAFDYERMMEETGYSHGTSPKRCAGAASRARAR